MTFFFLLACQPSKGDSAYVPDPGSEIAAAALPDPAWDAEGVAEQINTTLALGIPDPTTTLHAYQDMWVGSDPDCPMSLGAWSMTEIVTSCDADSGWVYAGVTGYEPGDDEDFWLMGDGYIQDGDGVVFTLAGELERVTTDAGWETKMTGQWQYPASAIPWIAGGTGLALWAALGADGVQLDGGYGVNDVNLNFDAVIVGPGCASGIVWLRDPGGAWYVVTLADTCDACGTVAYGDDELGDVCLNLDSAVIDLASRLESL